MSDHDILRMDTVTPVTQQVETLHKAIRSALGLLDAACAAGTYIAYARNVGSARRILSAALPAREG